MDGSSFGFSVTDDYYDLLVRCMSWFGSAHHDRGVDGSPFGFSVVDDYYDLRVRCMSWFGSAHHDRGEWMVRLRSP